MTVNFSCSLNYYREFFFIIMVHNVHTNRMRYRTENSVEKKFIWICVRVCVWVCVSYSIHSQSVHNKYVSKWISFPYRVFSYFPHQKTCWYTVMKANQKPNDGLPLFYRWIGFKVLDAFKVNHLSLNVLKKKKYNKLYAQYKNCCTELLYNQNDNKKNS